MSDQRRARVASAIRSALSELIRGLSDPRLSAAGLPSINHVEVGKDLAIANVYVSFIGGDESKTGDAIDSLTRASGRLRGPVGRQLNLKRCPELRFFVDDGAEFRERLAGILAVDANRGEPDGNR